MSDLDRLHAALSKFLLDDAAANRVRDEGCPQSPEWDKAYRQCDRSEKAMWAVLRASDVEDPDLSPDSALRFANWLMSNPSDVIRLIERGSDVANG